MGMAQNDNIHFGTFTVNNSINGDYNIAHGFTVIPSLFIVLNHDANSTSNIRRFVLRDSTFEESFGIFGANASSGNKNDLRENPTSYAIADSTNIILKPLNTPWGAGEYLWIAIK